MWISALLKGHLPQCFLLPNCLRKRKYKSHSNLAPPQSLSDSWSKVKLAQVALYLHVPSLAPFSAVRSPNQFFLFKSSRVEPLLTPACSKVLEHNKSRLMSGRGTNCRGGDDCSKLVWHTRDLWAISATNQLAAASGIEGGGGSICVSGLVLFHVDLIQSGFAMNANYIYSFQQHCTFDAAVTSCTSGCCSYFVIATIKRRLCWFSWTTHTYMLSERYYQNSDDAKCDTADCNVSCDVTCTDNS